MCNGWVSVCSLWVQEYTFCHGFSRYMGLLSSSLPSISVSLDAFLNLVWDLGQRAEPECLNWNVKSSKMLNHSSLFKGVLALCGESMQTVVIIKLSLRTAGYNESTAVHVGAVAATASVEIHQGCLTARIWLALLSVFQDWWPRGLLKL